MPARGGTLARGLTAATRLRTASSLLWLRPPRPTRKSSSLPYVLATYSAASSPVKLVAPHSSTSSLTMAPCVADVADVVRRRLCASAWRQPRFGTRAAMMQPLTRTDPARPDPSGSVPKVRRAARAREPRVAPLRGRAIPGLRGRGTGVGWGGGRGKEAVGAGVESTCAACTPTLPGGRMRMAGSASGAHALWMERWRRPALHTSAAPHVRARDRRARVHGHGRIEAWTDGWLGWADGGGGARWGRGRAMGSRDIAPCASRGGENVRG